MKQQSHALSPSLEGSYKGEGKQNRYKKIWVSSKLSVTMQQVLLYAMYLNIQLRICISSAFEQASTISRSRSVVLIHPASQQN